MCRIRRPVRPPSRLDTLGSGETSPTIRKAIERGAAEQAELNRKRREAVLHKIQQLVHERTIYAPICLLAFINGAGPRVGESGLGRIADHAYSAPYEDVTLKGK